MRPTKSIRPLGCKRRRLVRKDSNVIRDTTYTFYSDPGHAWLRVPLSTLSRLDIRHRISRFSYVSNDLSTVYLEEDRDASVFIDAYQQRFGKPPAIKEQYIDDREQLFHDAINYRSNT